MLCGLGFLLATRTDERHQGDVDVTHIVTTYLVTPLANGLQERQNLDVAHGATNFGDDDIDIFGSDALNTAFDLVSDVRNDLHRAAEIIPAAFGCQNGLINRTRRGVRRPGEVFIDEPLVVTEIQIGFTTVVGDENFAVFERVHRAWVDVDVRIQFLHGDAQTTHLEQAT